MPTLLVVPAMLLILAALPLVVACDAWSRRRQRAIANGTGCVRCGQRLGTAALDAADAVLRQEQAALQQRFPHALVDVRRRVDARCTACRADYVWDGPRRALRLLPLPIETE